MTRYAAEISYDGSCFSGWQKQPERSSVQQALEEAASLLNGSFVPVAGAGRTDAGVHAKGQVCSFELAREWDARQLTLAMNSKLPEGVSVMKVAAVAPDFHARYSALRREYRYFIWNSGTIYPHLKGRVYWLKGGSHNWNSASSAAEYLLGTHDFHNFCKQESCGPSTIRTITNISLRRKKELVVLKVEGDGFLHNMVRIILGNLELAALGKIKPEQMKELLSRENTRGTGGRTFPPCGLYLWKITYSGKLW